MKVRRVRWPSSVGACLLLLFVLLAGCAPPITAEARYRITAVLELDGNTYTASAVQELRGVSAMSFVTPNEWGVHSVVRGQAAVMEIPRGHLVFLLEARSGDLGTAIIRTCDMLDAQNPYQTVANISAFRGPCRLSYPDVPVVVWIDEGFRPESMEDVAFGEEATGFRKLDGDLSFVIEATEDPLAFDLDQIMPWLIEQRDPEKYKPRAVSAEPRDYLVTGPEFINETF